MRNTLIIIRHEIVTTLQKRSFWVMTFLFPTLMLGLSIGMQTVGTRAIEIAEENASTLDAQFTTIGYVDESGLLTTLPEWVPAGYLTSYPDAESANAALTTGVIQQYYHIPADFYESGSYQLVDANFQPLRSASNAEIFEEILNDALFEQDPLGELLSDPTPRVHQQAQAPFANLDEDDQLTFVIPMASLFIFFFVITTSGGFMLTSITKEKENRTAETLLVSLAPRELMMGKMLGLGVVALLQMSIWLSGALFTLNRRNQLSALGQNFSLPEGFVIWVLLFFLLGYFLFGSILGTIGVLAPNTREGGQFTFLAVLPLLVPLWLNYAFTEMPDGALSIFLSLFPLTAPSSMITRMAVSTVPLWQVLLSLTGLALTAYFFMLVSARLFRADNLLSSASLNWKRLRQEFFKRKTSA